MKIDMIKLKAEALSNLLDNLKPGKAISWPIYEGNNILDARKMENHVTPFFRTGMPMPIPIPVPNLGLDIHSIETGYDDKIGRHKVIIEGIVVKMKKENEK
jgi:hypothetical protein